MTHFIPSDKCTELLAAIKASPLQSVYDAEKHRLRITDETGENPLYFRLPITMPTATPWEAQGSKVHYVILLIQSGNCAVGYFENGRCLDHKVYRSYMVRKKQGKSQIKYLKTKGKSRAGSRVRLGETVEFFENINGRLQEYFEDHVIDRIALSCSKTLLPYLFNSKVSTPFDKRDPRILKIPKHIHTPIYEVLLDTNRFLMRGELTFDKATEGIANGILAKAGIAEPQDSHQHEKDILELESDDASYPNEDGDEWDEDWE